MDQQSRQQVLRAYCPNIYIYTVQQTVPDREPKNYPKSEWRKDDDAMPFMNYGL